MVVLVNNIGAIEMLDSKTGQCKTKHIDTRFHWIKQYVDENKVKVNYVKSENNVVDILTKNLQPRLFEKHANKLVTNIVDEGKQMNDIGFFVRCNTRLMGKGQTWRDTDEAKEERLRLLAEPMGEIHKYRTVFDYRVIEWVPNRARLKQLRKKVQGPRQLYYMYMK